MTQNMPFLSEEQQYLQQLEHERYMFGWCLSTYAAIDVDIATAKAAAFYPYRAPDYPERELVFHDEAWHWAMLEIFGKQYWLDKPEYQLPSEQYIAASDNYLKENIFE